MPFDHQETVRGGRGVCLGLVSSVSERILARRLGDDEGIRVLAELAEVTSRKGATGA